MATGVSPVCAPEEGKASCEATLMSLRSLDWKVVRCTVGGAMMTSFLQREGEGRG